MSLGTPALNQGSSSTQNVNITQVNGGAISLGQKTMANSFPVVIASDQSAISVSQSGNWTARIVGNIGGILDAVIGAAIPANAIFVGANKSGNLSYLNLDSSNNLMVNVSNFAIGTFGNSDGTAANLTSGLAFSEGLLYNGTSWDRWRGDTTNGAWVNVKNTPTVTANAGTGTFNIQSNASVNINQVGGSAVSTAATGIQKVGITGNTGAAMDAAGQNAASPANELLIGGQFNTTPTTITSGNISPLQLDNAGNLLSKINVALPTGANTIGAVTQASGPWTSNVTQINGSAISTATTGTQLVGLADGAGNKLTTNSTTYTAKFALDGNLLGTLGTAFSTAGKVDVKGADGDVFVRQATASNLKAQVVAGDATGSAVPANAYYDAGLAKTALPTAASDGNLTGVMMDKFGRQVVLPVTIRDLVGTQTTTISASTTETTIVTAAASTFNDLLLLVCSNTSATAARLDFRDTTGGSVLFSIYVPAGDVRGFSLGGVPIPQTSVNTNWTAQSSASVTDLRIYAVWVKNK